MTHVLVVIGCTRGLPSTPSAPEPQRQPAQPDRPVMIEGPVSWQLSPGSGPRSYTTTESTTVTLESVRDSTTTTTTYTLLNRRRDSLVSIQGTVDRITNSRGTPDLFELFPFPFTGYVRSGGITVDSVRGQQVPAVMTCENPALNYLAVIRRNVFVTPSGTLMRNQAWTDSSTVPACSGSVPVQVTSIRSYRVLGESEGKIMVDRQDRTTASGEGAQGQHRINIQSQGTGSARLQLDRLTGEVISASGISQTEVTIGSSGRVQRFVQVVKDHTVRR